MAEPITEARKPRMQAGGSKDQAEEASGQRLEDGVSEPSGALGIDDGRDGLACCDDASGQGSDPAPEQELVKASGQEPVPDGGGSRSVFALTPSELGLRGEKAARRYLERRGSTVLDVNWRCFAGEADIVAMDGDVLSFVEVKTRRGLEKGFPSEAVDAKKRERYEKIAACYLQEHDYVDTRVRFDVISILVLDDQRAFLRMHVNAFCGS